MKKCKNCKFGNVEGGRDKRIKRNSFMIESLREEELSKVKNKYKKKEEAENLRIITKDINKKYDKIIQQENNVLSRKSKCYYCQGKGMRGNLR